METKHQIPRFEDEDHEREFWAWHDSTDFVDWSEAQRITQPDLEPCLAARDAHEALL